MVYVFHLPSDLYRAIDPFRVNKLSSFHHNAPLEVIWTLIPAAILVAIAVPSFTLLYASDDVGDPALTIKVIGHQWY